MHFGDCLSNGNSIRADPASVTFPASFSNYLTYFSENSMDIVSIGKTVHGCTNGPS